MSINIQPSQPTIEEAEDLAVRHRKSAVAILFFGNGQFGFASYGMTRRRCRAMGRVMDQIHDLIANGTISVEGLE